MNKMAEDGERVTRRPKYRQARAVVALLALAATTLSGMTVAHAQDKTCDGQRVIPFTFHITAPRIIDIPLKDPVPRGEYRTNTYSFDSYESRSSETIPQPFEQWFVEFLDEDGFVIDATDPTSDLPDAVAVAEIFDNGSLTLNRPAVALRLHHVHDDKTEPNSVHPGCLGLSSLTVATTVAPTTTPTTAPPATVAPTTTAPAEVLATTVVAMTLPRTGVESSNSRGLAAAVLVSGGFALLVGSRRRDLLEASQG